MKEEVFKFGRDDEMVGVASLPESSSDVVAFVLSNAGLLHRAGPNRLYVQLARAIASTGHLAFRFDGHGLGDSQHSERENTGVDDTREAIDFLAKTMGTRRFVLMGLCSGAVSAFMCAQRDERVVGIALFNPLGGELLEQVDPALRTETRWRYYHRALRSRESWSRALTGQTNYRRFASSLVGRMTKAFVPKDPKVDFVEVMRPGFAGLLERGTQILVVHTEWGEEAELIKQLRLEDTSRRRALTVRMAKNCDHSFTPLRCQQYLLEVVREWVATSIVPAGSLERRA
jgi:pimeloyl-ACP methyl ester carboxylesterase